MQGIILLWYGAVEELPFSWHECDGTHGTPNLKNKWIRGAGNTFAVGEFGGFKNHRHAFTSDTHDHNIPSAPGPLFAGTGTGATVGTRAVTGYTDFTNAVPPYHCLVYIQKL